MGFPGIVIQIGAETKGAIDGINRVNKALGEQTGAQKFKAGMEKAFVPATAALGALTAGALVAAKAGEELVSSQTALSNVMEKMGYAESTERLTALADEMERLLGVDEKVILQVQTSLGTFGELAKSADTAGGAFDRATNAALDLAAAGFGTAEGNAVQLGKALNDPIKGLASLAKSGVTFTEAEKDKIKALVESNKMMEAQSLVLDAIEKQVGGTALATADSSAKMSLAFDDIKESLGVALLPLFDAMNDKLAAFAGWVQENQNWVIGLGAAIGGVAGAIVAVNLAMKAWAAAQVAIQVITKAWTAAQWLLNAALNANPIGLVVMAIAALIGIVVLAYNKVDWFRDLVDKAWAGIKIAIEVVVQWFQDTAWPILKKVFGFIVAYVETLWTVYKTVWDNIYAVVETVVLWFQDTVWPIIETVIGAISDHIEDLGRGWGIIWDAIGTAVEKAWEFMRPIIDRIKGAIDGIKSAWDTVSNIGGAIGSVLPWNRSANVAGSDPFLANVRSLDPFQKSSTFPLAAGNGGGSVGAGATIIVQGAIDPVSTAKQIRRILATGDVRLGVA